MIKRYTVSDGNLTLVLEEADEGGYTVTSPVDPELITEADSVEEAFEMAKDALKVLKAARVQLARDLRKARLQLLSSSSVVRK